MTTPPPGTWPGPDEPGHQATRATHPQGPDELGEFGPADIYEAIRDTEPGLDDDAYRQALAEVEARGRDLAEIWGEASAQAYQGWVAPSESAERPPGRPPVDPPGPDDQGPTPGPDTSPWWAGRTDPRTSAPAAPWGGLGLPYSPLALATNADMTDVLAVCQDMLGWRRAVSVMADDTIPACWMHHPDLVEAIWEWARAYQATHRRGVDGTAGIIWMQQTHWLLTVWLADNSWVRDCVTLKAHQPSRGYGVDQRDRAFQDAWATTGQAPVRTWIWPPVRPIPNEQEPTA